MSSLKTLTQFDSISALDYDDADEVGSVILNSMKWKTFGKRNKSKTENGRLNFTVPIH